MRRRMMMQKGTPSILPAGYNQLNFIESTGTQYINTGYKVKSDYNPYKIMIDFQLTNGSGKVIGAMSSGKSKPLRFGTSAEKWYFSHYGNTMIGSATFGVADAERHTMEYLFGEGVYLDGVLAPETVQSASASSNCDLPLYLFAENYYGRATSISEIRLYRCKLYEANEVLARDFVPCQRTTDGAIGLFDTVTQQFFSNAGTGEFIGG